MTKLQDHVLIVDDELPVVMSLSMLIEDLGMEVCATAETADDAVALAQVFCPSIVLMGVRLQGEKDGIDAAIAIRALVGAKIIFLSGTRDPATTERIWLADPTAVLFKPVSDRELMDALETAAQH
jgi:two-component system, response regulator PdtaR